MKRHPVRPDLFPALALTIVLSLMRSAPISADGLDLGSLSLEDLMEIEVDLVSRQPERVSDVPAAIAVLTNDDLRRAGVRELPEALRLVPGIHVGRVDANKWAVTTRGFNSLFANKLLVLIDGRSVYTPAFSGVFWDAQDVVMADVERIEVIRGPGGTLWGANAVNGIINIVTQPAARTQGTYVQLGSGLHERVGVTVRHGARLSDQVALRLYGRYFDRDASIDTSGSHLSDDWSVARVGARLDWTPSAFDRVSLHSTLYAGDLGGGLQLVSQLTPPYVADIKERASTRGGFLMGVWEHDNAGGDSMALQVYYDHSRRADPPILEGIIDIVDVDFHHRRPVGAGAFSWGLGYRGVTDDVDGSFAVRATPAQRTTHLFSGFAQADGTLGPRRHVGWSFGSKVEHNGHTGFEAQPGMRLWWAPAPRHMLWSSVSRAVRTPSRSDNDMEFAAQVVLTQVAADSALPTLITLIGDPALQAENLVALELGYRARVRSNLSVDIALFRNRYEDLRTSDAIFPVLRNTPVPHFYLPLRAANNGRGTT
ncbi:MAG: TonB-dependent receptor, partial [bacterium]|nr:TonB-dependent receptor [bacterium]